MAREAGRMAESLFLIEAEPKASEPAPSRRLASDSGDIGADAGELAHVDITQPAAAVRRR